MNNIVDINEKAKPRKAGAAGGSGGGWDTHLETRVGNLETKVDKIDGRLDNIERILFEIQTDLKYKASSAEIAEIRGDLKTKASASEIAEIRGDLKTKASASELAEVKGKVAQIPNTWQLMLGLIGFAGFIFAIVKFIK
jgi:hypothetical protein